MFFVKGEPSKKGASLKNALFYSLVLLRHGFDGNRFD